MKTFKKELSLLLVAALVISSIIIGFGTVNVHASNQAIGQMAYYMFQVKTGIGSDCGSGGETTNNCVITIYYSDGTSAACNTIPGESSPNYFEQNNTDTIILSPALPAKPISTINMISSGGDKWKVEWANFYYSPDSGGTWLKIATLGAFDEYSSNKNFIYPSDYSLNTSSLNKTLTFNANGGTGGKQIWSEYGATLPTSNVPTVTRTGYTFAGWSPAVPANGPSADTTYTAQWTPLYSNITFDANGGTGGTGPTSMSVGSALTPPTVARTDYTFVNWLPEVPAAVPAADATYTAQWRETNPAVTFDSNGGSAVEAITPGYNNAASKPADPVKAGLTFGGWYREPALTTAVYWPFTVTQSMAFYARWNTENSYTIIFDANGGTGGTSNALPAGDPLEAPSVAKTGYNLAGWSPGLPGFVPADNTIYTAQWEANTYTVSYNGNGNDAGSTASSLHTYDSTSALTANGFAKVGHSLSGWSTDSGATAPEYTDGQSVLNLTQNRDEVITFYAVWSVNSYTITFNANGGTGGTSSSKLFGSALMAPTVTKTGYTFANWSPEVPATVPAGNTTYTAQWTANQYLVTFDPQGGTVSPISSTVTYGSTYGAGTGGFPTPTKTGYAFGGWYTGTNGSGSNRFSTTTVSTASNHTLYAKWTGVSYTVAYNGNGSTGGSTASSTHTYGTAKTLTANGYANIGYAFVGWATSAGGDVVYTDKQSVLNLTETSGATVTLYAKWTDVNVATVTFDANGGTGTTSTTLLIGAPLTAPTVTRTGYTFTSWSPAVPSTVPEVNTIYTAQWTVNTYTVTFNPQSGTVTPTTSTVTYNSTYGAGTGGLPMPTRTGYIFGGWYTSTGGAGTNIISSTIVTITASQTLYAKWTAAQYVITFDANGGTGGTSNTMAYGTSITTPAVTKEGYTLIGWSPAVPATVPAADTTYTAQWGISVTITFDANGGTGGTSTIKGAGAALTAPTVSRTGYTFASWSPAVPSTVPGVNTTYTAQWTARTFTVTFNPQSGTVTPTTSTVTFDSTYGAGTGGWPTPTRPGYTFGGWFTSSGGAGTQIFSTTIAARTSSQTLYAYWLANTVNQATGQLAYYMFQVRTSNQDAEATGTANNLNVTINYSDGTSATSDTIPGESSPNYFEAGNTDYIVLSPQLPAKPISSITFNSIGSDRWKVDWTALVYSYDNGTNYRQIATTGGFDYQSGVRTMTYPSTYSLNTGATNSLNKILTFNANGGTGGKEIYSEQGATLPASNTPTVTRTGYTFAGWSPAVPAIGPSADTTYTAQWATSSVYITFDANGGTGGTSALMPIGTALSAPTVTKTGYHLTGWLPLIPLTVPETDTTYTAQWTIDTYNLSFNAEGGYVSPSSSTITYNSTYGAGTGGWPTPTRTGYTFGGWFTGQNGTGTQILSTTTVTPTSSKNLFAEWTAFGDVDITFDANGGTGGTSPSMTPGDALTAPTVTRTGYTFTNWSPAVPSTVPAENTTYTAQWTARTYTVYFDAQGGSVSPNSSTVTYNSTYGAGTAGLPIPTRTGYTFGAWYTGPGGTGTYISSNTTVQITAAQTLYAIWNQNNYTVTLDPQGGTVTPTTVTVIYSSNYGSLPIPIKAGSTFGGWYTGVGGTGTEIESHTTVTYNSTANTLCQMDRDCHYRHNNL